jgi:hypothetical protein
LGTSHRRPDPPRFGLVAGRQDYATTNDHRAAAQAGIVTLLDRRVEGVQVGM